MTDDLMIVSKLSHKSDRQSLLEKIERCKIYLGHQEKTILEISKTRDKWKRRAKLFQKAYWDEIFTSMALTLQKSNLEANGADKVTAMQNKSLRAKHSTTCSKNRLLFSP